MFNNLFNKLKKNILVVEDDETLRGAISDKLRSEGYAVLEAADGSEALRIAFENHPNVILLDLMLPIMDGAEVLSELRKDAWGAKIPVIIVSNLPDDRELGKKYNVYWYVVKSDWKLADIALKVKSALKE
ncbi:MAG: hypothetical protein A2934_03625 [Candidatus Sungbacteria bacterium RIFCSPLOWO2_01_FULL_47_10]|uniref:Response regulatory domain-containing protein n=1 Tax=Candidatus Sungbacteria bacterium RIFCSPLOWO2_01_FULL_47_10 TaxID=1802276 RepID=A0A1G2L767_9BACT|nr:MAG: hypothetical protein A2934_03625 [Candidatus Sungbacteria bacterium RIFCSPLOWO2_01_FULL_47_10]